jgi:hypothetical protein
METAILTEVLCISSDTLWLSSTNGKVITLHPIDGNISPFGRKTLVFIARWLDFLPSNILKEQLEDHSTTLKKTPFSVKRIPIKTSF